MQLEEREARFNAKAGRGIGSGPQTKIGWGGLVLFEKVGRNENKNGSASADTEEKVKPKPLRTKGESRNRGPKRPLRSKRKGRRGSLASEENIREVVTFPRNE